MRRRSGGRNAAAARPGAYAASSGSGSDRRRISKSRPSERGGKGLRSQSQPWSNPAGGGVRPSSRSSDARGSRQRLPGPPSTASEPRASASSRSYASTGCNCTGVAVASSRLFVRGAISCRNRSRLLGRAGAKGRAASRFRRRARCASSRITHSKRMPASNSAASEPRVIRPVETIPTRRGQRRIDAGPAPGCSTPRSSTHCRPVQTADGMPSCVSSSSRHCRTSVRGARTSTGRSPVSAISWAAIASCSVLPRPTSSASTKRAPCGPRWASKASLTKCFWCSHRPASRR